MAESENVWVRSDWACAWNLSFIDPMWNRLEWNSDTTLQHEVCSKRDRGEGAQERSTGRGRAKGGSVRSARSLQLVLVLVNGARPGLTLGVVEYRPPSRATRRVGETACGREAEAGRAGRTRAGRCLRWRTSTRRDAENRRVHNQPSRRPQIHSRSQSVLSGRV